MPDCKTHTRWTAKPIRCEYTVEYVNFILVIARLALDLLQTCGGIAQRGSFEAQYYELPPQSYPRYISNGQPEGRMNCKDIKDKDALQGSWRYGFKRQGVGVSLRTRKKGKTLQCGWVMPIIAEILADCKLFGSKPREPGAHNPSNCFESTSY